ncbi:restriction endonuclease, partial [Algibacter sp. Ld11]|uniref:restriction endonuclease n=1 Tax=Algibacter sp. Ld11 TaxID=649150 RepID=UPI00386A5CCD
TQYKNNCCFRLNPKVVALLLRLIFLRKILAHKTTTILIRKRYALLEKMNWKKYEEEIFENFKSAYPNTKISYNQKIIGRYSKIERQIDVLIEGRIAGKKIRLVIDGKYYSENVDVKAVDSFISMVEDIDAAQGILITSKGYSQAAINRAYYGPTDIELDILNFDELKKFQGFNGFTYSGWHGAIIPAPFGWIVDGTQRFGSIANLYQRGKTYEEATKNGEFIYMNIFSYDEKIKNLNEVIKLQEEDTLDAHPTASFEYTDTIERKDKKETILRKILRTETDLEEYTGFVGFDKFCVFCVLFTPEQLKTKNIRKLEYVIERLTPMDVDLNSVASTKISECEYLISKSKSEQEKADLLIQIAEIHRDMKQEELAIENYEESIKIFPENYGATLALFEMHYETKHREKFTDKFFNIAPGNPEICDNIAQMYCQNEHSNMVLKFFEEKLKNYTENNRVSGDIFFVLGNVYMHLEDKKNALFNFIKSKEKLSKCLPENHQVFKTLNQIIIELEK